MQVDDVNGFLALMVPVIAVSLLGVGSIVWLVMSQRTKRQAIAAGMDAAAYRGLGPRWMALQIGVFCCGLGLAFCLIALLNVPDVSPLAWGLLLLGCGGALVVNHLILRRFAAR